MDIIKKEVGPAGSHKSTQAHEGRTTMRTIYRNSDPNDWDDKTADEQENLPGQGN